jgi:hypothetical protein
MSKGDVKLYAIAGYLPSFDPSERNRTDVFVEWGSSLTPMIYSSSI